MFKNRKKIIFAFAFAIISVLFFAQAFEKNISNEVSKIKTENVTDRDTSNESVVKETNIGVVKDVEKNTNVSNFATNTQIINKSQSAEIIILDKKIAFSFEEGDSLLDAMNELKNSGQISFSGKEFSAMGFFVEEINGFKQLPKERKYWRYYVNNKEAPVGISNYKLKNNDSIEWKLEAYK